jgi:hypothetical protein
MEVNIGKKVQRKPLRPKIETKKVGKKNPAPKSKAKPRVIPFPVEEVMAKGSELIDWASPGKLFGMKKKDRRPLVHIFISIAGAILVGTVMGFSVLALFFSERPNASNTNTIDVHLPKPAVESSTKEKVTPKKTVPVKPAMSIPELHVSLLQAGNYQSKSSANRVAEQYRTKGFAAVMSNQSPYRIYLGVAPDKTDANLLSKRYQAKGIKVYIKEQSYAGKRAEVKNLAATLKLGNELFHDLQALSVASITKSTKVQIPKDLTAKQQAFMKAAQTSPAYSPEIRAAMVELTRGLDQAVSGADGLSKHQNATLAWFVQEGLVRYATGYEHLLYVLSQKS